MKSMICTRTHHVRICEHHMYESGKSCTTSSVASSPPLGNWDSPSFRTILVVIRIRSTTVGTPNAAFFHHLSFLLFYKTIENRYFPFCFSNKSFMWSRKRVRGYNLSIVWVSSAGFAVFAKSAVSLYPRKNSKLGISSRFNFQFSMYVDM